MDTQVFVASTVTIGHELSRLHLLANKNLYSGARNNIVLFNSSYLFLNYIKKGNFIKSIAESNSNYFFTTSRLEFFPLVKSYAAKCDAGALEFTKYSDLTAALHKVYNLNEFSRAVDFTSPVDPVLFLFNNDCLGSKTIMKEISTKNYFTVSVADSNSLNTTGGGYVPLYGNDDSMSAMLFYCKFIHNCFKKTPGKKIFESKGDPRRRIRRVSSENEMYILNCLLKRR